MYTTVRLTSTHAQSLHRMVQRLLAHNAKHSPSLETNPHHFILSALFSCHQPSTHMFNEGYCTWFVRLSAH